MRYTNPRIVIINAAASHRDCTQVPFWHHLKPLTKCYIGIAG